jgi:hypothetical protein
MDQLGVGIYHEYLDLLPVDAGEFTALFNTILINVTSFFRDPDAWRVLQTGVIPALLTERSPGEPLRAWSTGCSSGQEAYTLAMLLAEMLLGRTRLFEPIDLKQRIFRRVANRTGTAGRPAGSRAGQEQPTDRLRELAGASAATRPRAGICSTSTSDCPPTRSGR